MAKRCMDLVVAVIALLVLAPLMVAIAIVIKLSSPGPVLYRGKRIGRYGKAFHILKFRTMVANASQLGPAITYNGDPRITRIGRLLRKAKLDELPNLINVLRGEMSLIGPRPEAPGWVGQYTERQRAVLSVRPGMTGLAQLKYPHEEELLNGADLETVYPRIMNDKLEIDLGYVNNWSLGLDMRILFETGAMLVKRLWKASLPQMAARRIALDLILVPCAYSLAWLIRFDGSVPAIEWHALIVALPFITMITVLANFAFGIHRRLWAYAGIRDATLLVKAACLSTLILATGNLSVGRYFHLGLSTGGLLTGGLLTLALTTLLKYRRQLALTLLGNGRHIVQEGRERMLIVGIDGAAQQLAAQVYLGNYATNAELVGFIHEDPHAKGLSINGLSILGTPAEIPQIVRERGVDVIVIAQRPADRKGMWQLIATCRETPAQIKILPDIAQVLEGDYQDPLTLHDVSIGDVAGRAPVAIDEEACRRIVTGKVVLVTGAAGSIGSELCRQLLGFQPRLLVALDNNETGLFDLSQGLNPEGQMPLQLAVADVTDWHKMDRLCHQHRPQVVFHVAAYKHVPLVESHPDEALRVNVLGTVVTSEVAHSHHVERFVFISTDKAVNPTNVMGASKRIGELWIKAMSERSETVFTSVRFGNVIGSRGSVLLTFARQIEMGGPVTVTDPGMYRFFVSIPEAVSLVLQAATYGQGGDIYMLDMGEEVSILRLAERMIRIKGLRVNRDIGIKFVGMRPGEKLHEELAYSNEPKAPTPHPRIYSLQCQNGLVDHDTLLKAISLLSACTLAPQGMEYLSDGLFKVAAQDMEGFFARMHELGLEEGEAHTVRRM